MIVLYDGWDLAYRPNSPAALHLLTLLWRQSEGFQARVGLPADSIHLLPESVDAQVMSVPDTASGRLHWEQRLLPQYARRVEAEWTHYVSGGPALFGRVPSLFSPASFSLERLFGGLPGRRPGFAGRLREAFAQGGLARAGGLLWPADLPRPQFGLPVFSCAPMAPLLSLDHSAQKSDGLGLSLEQLDLPDTYILYHGPANEKAVVALLDAWMWAAASIGEYYPLLVLGFTPVERAKTEQLLEQSGIARSVRVLPPLSVTTIVKLFQDCSAVFHPAQMAPWGGPLRLALACARPVVALDTPLTDALVGPAAYLAAGGRPPQERSRALGAALISVIVEESVAAALSQAARLRSAAWDVDAYQTDLEAVYRLA